MNATQVVSLVTGILGAVLGSAGLAVSLLTYLRDRPQLKISLRWDMTDSQRGNTIGLVRVTNVGRRPLHIGAVALQLPAGYEHDHLLLNDSMIGTTLDEGSKPAAFIVNYDGLAKYKPGWAKIRATAEDSTGKAYFSPYPKKKPSWAK